MLSKCFSRKLLGQLFTLYIYIYMGQREYDGEIFKYLSNILHTSFNLKLCYIMLFSLVKVDLENIYMSQREYDGEIFKYLSNILHTSFNLKLCYIILFSLVKVDLENRLTTEYKTGSIIGKVLDFLQIYNLRNVLCPVNYIFEGVISFSTFMQFSLFQMHRHIKIIRLDLFLP